MHVAPTQPRAQAKQILAGKHKVTCRHGHRKLLLKTARAAASATCHNMTRAGWFIYAHQQQVKVKGKGIAVSRVVWQHESIAQQQIGIVMGAILQQDW
jgi:hypothetical protein